ncbi:MAG: magnesium and cobalt transport protein CorA [Deltaproteobacteria bacterium RIFCSPLOWO2_02_FULL_50_16]|nr:MAG: magnesium and cobalt transport protein CorA [Deltaproteobacteria bacterium GWA2_50_8]OGQ57660.1 MAG: magnesium and cobalt transport protein CorA [Deltaproteobacteria bacterium RIFCSPLOWO2_02_FULL_50_16]OGQ67875.1 MAG: magnesium and cobalt transport protein CorA [Deltaproteobacteria bacterium RIFCSPLOWO2_12_FULL_50_11]
MITLFSYSEAEGFVHHRSIEPLRTLVQDPKQIIWLDIEEPTPEETEILDTCFNFHPLTIDDCLSERQDPKVDNYGDYLFIVAQEILPESSTREFNTDELFIYLGKNYLLTYHHLPLRSTTILKDRIWKNARSVFRSADFILALLLDEIVDLYNPLIDHYDQRIDIMEDQVLEESKKNILNEIFDCKKSLSRLKRNNGKQEEMIRHLIKDGYDKIIPTSIPYLSNVHDHLLIVAGRSDSYKDSLNSLIDAHLMTSTNKANEIMKVLTLFAAIMLPLTVITGIYGMNFKWIPELDWKYGYGFALSLMALVGGTMLYFFWKKKWL